MNKKQINCSALLVSTICTILLGILIIYGRSKLYAFVFMSIAAVIVIHGLFHLVTFFIRKNKQKNENFTITGAVLNILFGLFILIFPKFSLSILPILFSIYTIFNGLVKLITYFIYRKNAVSGRFHLLLDAVLYLIFGLILLFSPLLHLDVVLVIIGIYCILLGLTFFKDFLREVVPTHTKNNLKRKVRIALPVIFQALIPYKMLKKINEYFDGNNSCAKLEAEGFNPNSFSFEEKNGNEFLVSQIANDITSPITPDLEVLIHVSNDGIGAFGHVDICFEGKIISYGNYDEKSFLFAGAICDGILFFTKKEEYIKFCIRFSKKTIFSYGLKLSEEQKEIIRTKITEIRKNLVPWEPNSAKDYAANIDIKKKKYRDYPSNLYKATSADFYKFKTGKFKTYFIFGTNCVLLADTLIGHSGIDILQIHGIICPGTYYDYFDKEFNRKNSFVITKNIYK